MQRRKFLATVGVGVASGVAGCASDGGQSNGVDTAVSDSSMGTGSASTASGGTPAMNAPFEHAGTIEARMAAIGDDGSFTLHLKFADVSSDTQIEVSTPAFTVTGPLGELASGVVDG